ncbi:hypothetical protein BK127_27345 [Paenibacillus sp. FSL H7-0331]|nr:hypothetical protein BK127_27345 [Paenibacillus sp. FSL H7-0331]
MVISLWYNKENRMEGIDSMHSRNRLIAAVSLIILTLVLSWTYPDATPLGEQWLTAVGLPTWSNGHSGINYFSILLLLIAFTGLFLLRSSLYKHPRIIVLAAIIALLWLPANLVIGYQTVFAKGIYTLEYDKQGSSCSFKREEQWLNGSCTLTFINHGQSVDFSVMIRKEPFPNNAFLEQLDVLGDQTLHMAAHNKSSITVTFKKWVGDVETPFSGSMSGFDITVKNEVAQRHL